MSTVSALSPAQQADIIARHRDGRPDITVMTGEERRARGLMTLGQAAEHEGLAARVISCTKLADRVRGMDPDDIWTVSAEEAAGRAAGEAWREAGHEARGCYGWSQDFLATEVMCACGDRVRLPETAATG